MNKLFAGATVCALIAIAPAFAQSNNSNVTTPSAQNSGTGISGAPGNKNGPAPEKGTVGSSATSQENSTVRQQDSSKVQGLPGNKSGPPAKQPSGK